MRIMKIVGMNARDTNCEVWYILREVHISICNIILTTYYQYFTLRNIFASARLDEGVV